MDVDFANVCPLVRPALPHEPTSFRFALALRLCFNSIGLHRGDFNPQAAGHVRHTGSRCTRRGSAGFPPRTFQGLVRRPVRRVGLNSSTFGGSCHDQAGSRRPLLASCNRPAGRQRPLHPGPAPSRQAVLRSARLGDRGRLCRAREVGDRRPATGISTLDQRGHHQTACVRYHRGAQLQLLFPRSVPAGVLRPTPRQETACASSRSPRSLAIP